MTRAKILIGMTLVTVAQFATAQSGTAPSDTVTHPPIPVVTQPTGPSAPTEDTPVARGYSLFQYYCARCHGPKGEGDGRAAKLYDPKPGNLTQSRGSVRALEKMIREGGEANGISQFMPPLGEELSPQQISDLAAFVISLRKRHN